MTLNSTNRLTIKLNSQSSSDEINIVLAILKLTQDDVAKTLKVKQASISMAINNDPLLKKLRERLINHLNSLQFRKENETHAKAS